MLDPQPVLFDNYGKEFHHSHTIHEVQQILSQEICKIIPEAEKESEFFRFAWTGNNYILDATTVSPELYKKIAQAFGK